MAAVSEFNIKRSNEIREASSNPKIASACLSPLFNSVLQACFKIQSVCGQLPNRSVAICARTSGCVLEMSFRLFATLFLTYNESSCIKRSRTGESVRSDLQEELGMEIPHGRRGLEPSLASLLTCSSGCSVQERNSLNIRSRSSLIYGRTANSEVEKRVKY